MSSNGTLLNNPSDPLHQNPDVAKELFRQLGAVSNAFPLEMVETAAFNLLLNVVRQRHANRNEADARWSELTGKGRGVLMDHYDPVTQKRRNIFPFAQTINAAHFSDRRKAG